MLRAGEVWVRVIRKAPTPRTDPNAGLLAFLRDLALTSDNTAPIV